jgi:YVTN family beta-propeller protein
LLSCGDKIIFFKISSKERKSMRKTLASLAAIMLGAFSSVSGYEIWVTNQGTNSEKVQIIDSKTLSVVAEVTAGKKPHNITFNKDFSLAYVANVGSNDVTVIDAKKRKVVATIPTATRAHGVTLSPNGKFLYVANAGDNSISVVDTKTRKVTKTIKVGNAPMLAAFSPDGKKAYVSNGKDATVSVIDVEKGEAIKTIPNVGADAMGMTVSKNGKLIVTGGGDHKYSIIDTSKDEVIHDGTAGKEAHGVVLSRDGTKALIPNRQSGDISIVEIASGKVVETIADVGDKTDIIDISPDGKRAFVTLRGSAEAGVPHAIAGRDSGVAVVDLEKKRVVNIVKVGGDPHGIAVRTVKK